MKTAKKILMGAAMLAAALVFSGNTAQANTIKETGIAVTGSAGAWTYDYTLSLDSNSQLIGNNAPNPHEFFILDFPGLTGVSFTPNAVTLTAGGLKGIASSEAVTTIDSTGLSGFGLLGTTLISGTTYKLTADNSVTKNAKLVIADIGAAGSGVLTTTTAGVTIGHLFVTSTVGPTLTNGSAISIDHDSSTSDQITLTVPDVPQSVPLPAAVWAGGLLLSGLVVRRIRRNR